MRLVLLVLAALAVTLPLAPRVAHAQARSAIKPEAEVRFKRGLEYYKMREFEAAIAEFEAAYAIDPRPEILFSQAQAERLSGDCASAVVLYRKFLESDPPAVHAEAARASLDKCEVALRSRPPGPPGKDEPAPEPAAKKPAVTSTPAAPTAADAGKAVEPGPDAQVATPARPARPRRAARPFWKDPVGDALAGAGLVALAVGAFYFVGSANDASAAGDATSWSEHQRLLDRAESRRQVAWIGLGAGSALVLGATLRWSLAGDGGGGERAGQGGVRVGATLGGGVIGVSAAGRF